MSFAAPSFGCVISICYLPKYYVPLEWGAKEQELGKEVESKRGGCIGLVGWMVGMVSCFVRVCWRRKRLYIYDSERMHVDARSERQA